MHHLRTIEFQQTQMLCKHIEYLPEVAQTCVMIDFVLEMIARVPCGRMASMALFEHLLLFILFVLLRCSCNDVHVHIGMCIILLYVSVYCWCMYIYYSK